MSKKKLKKPKTKGTLDYPVSTKYRENWGEWEAIREIVQNAIDSGAKTAIRFDEGTKKLVVRDFGDGFALRNLLIGETSKDGVSSIGKFGEGMKFAFLVLLRMDCDVKVQSNGLLLTPRLKETFGVPTLTIDYRQLRKSIKGTKVTINGVTQDYRDRFRTTRQPKERVDRVLVDEPGKLYIKGIYVKDLQAVAGYDLNIERDNPMSGDVDMYAIRSRVAILIRETKDKDYIRKLIGLSRDVQESTEYLELECGQHDSWHHKHPNLWKRALKAEFGTVKVCRVTDLDSARLAQYKGYQTIPDQIPFMRPVTRRDVEVVRKPKPKKQKRIGRSNLGQKARANLKWGRRLLEAATETKIRSLKVVEFKEDPTQTGAGKYLTFIKLSSSVLEDRQSLLETLMHEMVHYLWGYRDLTHEFQEGLGRLAAMVAMHMVMGKEKRREAKKEKKVKKAERKSSTRTEWIMVARREREGMASVKADLISAKMSELFHIASVFDVKAVGKKKGLLVEFVTDAIFAALDDELGVEH